MADPVRSRVREATRGDLVVINGLLAELGAKQRSLAGWRWLFEQGPASEGASSPAGWVLEDDAGAIQGYLGNILLDYVFDGAPVKVAACTDMAIRSSAGRKSGELLSAWLNQPGPDLFMTTSATSSTDPHFRALEAETPIGPSFSQGLRWVASDRVALEDTLVRQASVPAPVRGVASALGGPVARLGRRLSGKARAPRRRGDTDVRRVALSAIDGRFDVLWDQLRSRRGLQLVRDARHLRWTLGDPDAGSEPVLFGAFVGRELVGYAVAALHRPTESPALQLRLADLVVRTGRVDSVAPLLRRVVEHGREVGAGFVTCPPCGAELHRQLVGLGAQPQPLDHATHFLRARDSARTRRYSAPGAWLATGVDGDIPFCFEVR